ncbi:MAG TPA: DinB family protein [Acidimicrobiales bacterium]|nr:DinB family protein [Acidimicrobiales bacterium]
MARWPDDIGGLRSAWVDITTEWRTTDERARTLGDDSARRRVADEWSYVETTRHLVFVVDLWIRGAVLSQSSPFRPEGLPPTFMPPAAFPGVDAALEVSLGRAIELRHEAEAAVASLLADLDDDGLSRPCGRAGEHTVLGCLKTVLHEADLHRQFAARDLAALEAG